MTTEELEILAKQGEGYTLEFKENLGKKFAVEVVAFANGMGGKIQFDRTINKKAKYPEDVDENAYKNFLKLSNTSETIEKAGTGIGRMRELMKNAGLKEPEFQYDEFFEASFLRPSYYDKNYGTYDLANKNKVNNYKIPLSKIQQEIINIIIERPNITQSDIAKKLKVSRQSIVTNIKELKDNNVIERVGANKKGYWKILLDLQ